MRAGLAMVAAVLLAACGSRGQTPINSVPVNSPSVSASPRVAQFELISTNYEVCCGGGIACTVHGIFRYVGADGAQAVVVLQDAGQLDNKCSTIVNASQPNEFVEASCSLGPVIDPGASPIAHIVNP